MHSDSGAKAIPSLLAPPGSECSIHIGSGVTPAPPGCAQGLYLVVFDLEAARAELIRRGIEVGEFFHRGPKGLLQSARRGDFARPIRGALPAVARAHD